MFFQRIVTILTPITYGSSAKPSAWPSGTLEKPGTKNRFVDADCGSAGGGGYGAMDT
jgi:hypothetical protein